MVEKQGTIHRNVVEKLESRIAQLKNNEQQEEASKLEAFLNTYLVDGNFCSFPLGCEGTVVFRKSLQKEKPK